MRCWRIRANPMLVMWRKSHLRLAMCKLRIYNLMTLIDKAKNFATGVRTLTEWLGSGGQTVDQNLAQTRADVCLRCPNNGPSHDIVEATALAIKQQVELKNKLQLRVRGEKSLGSCSVCGCVMRLKIWLPIEKVKPDDE